MTKKQVDDFDKCCGAWADAYCEDHNCKPCDIPLEWAIETAEMHLGNIENGTWGFEDCWCDDEREEYKATKAFIRKYKRYCK